MSVGIEQLIENKQVKNGTRRTFHITMRNVQNASAGRGGTRFVVVCVCGRRMDHGTKNGILVKRGGCLIIGCTSRWSVRRTVSMWLWL